MKWADYPEEMKERYRAKSREYKKANKEKIKLQRAEYDANYYKNLSPERKEKLRLNQKQNRKVKEKAPKKVKEEKPKKPTYADTFLSRAIKAHNGKYDYSKTVVTKSDIKVIISCEIHGEFNQRPVDHLNGYGCPKCGKTQRLTTQEFINRSISIHGHVYDYSLAEYVNAKIDVKIICPVHGEFKQRPNNHLNGKGCRDCGLNYGVWSYTLWEQKGLKSKNFDSFKAYIIECWSEEERFFKIGKTFNSIEKRFIDHKKMPYQFKVLKIIVGDAKYISEYETNMKDKNKKNSYLPKKQFNGRYECYSELDY
jgi:hypothetical protein